MFLRNCYVCVLRNVLVCVFMPEKMCYANGIRQILYSIY